ncbi:MAG: hypothetical protein ACLRIS_16640 [Flavonifractor plautii]
MKQIPGGVTAPKGFRAWGSTAASRAKGRQEGPDLILSDQECAAAAVYTMNRVKAAPSMSPWNTWRTAPPGAWRPTAATPTPAAP